MKHLKTRVVGIALAVSMLIGNTSVLADGGDVNQMSNAIPLTYGQMVHCEIPEGLGGKWYSFTPSSSGKYNISSWNELDDPKLYFYSSSGELITTSDDIGDGYNFGLNEDLSAGETYYLWVSNYGNPDVDVFDFSVSWPGVIDQWISIDNVGKAYDSYGVDYGTESTVSLNVEPPEGAEYTYKWYTVSLFGEREEIAGATGSSYTIDVNSNVYEVDIFLGDIARTCSFRIYWNDSPSLVSPDDIVVSLGDAGTATTAEVLPFGGSDNLRYLACPSYYEWKSGVDGETFDYVSILNLPWSSTTTVEVPPLNVTTLDYYRAIDSNLGYFVDGYYYYYYSGMLASIDTQELLALVRSESNSGTISVGQTQEAVLYNVQPEADDYSAFSAEAGCYPDCYVYSFTPEASGTYSITSSDITTGDPFVAVFDDGYGLLGTADNLNNSFFTQDGVEKGDLNFSLPLHLEGGKTYYYAVWSYNFADSVPTEQVVLGQFKVTLTCDELDTFNVTVNSSGHGRASASPTSGTYGTEVNLTATPDSGYQFSSWEVISGGVTINNNRFTLGNSNVEVRANFEAIPTSAPSTPAPSTPTPTIPPSNNNTSTSEGGVAGFVERLYTIALGRASDPAGKQDWIDAITLRGETGAGAARGFLYSPEFLNKNVTNEEFVATLYRTFFDREPDQAGFNAWVEVLNNGGSKEEVIEGFINSTEWANLCLFYGIRNGGTGVPSIEIEPNQGTIDFATRLYTTCLGRNADQAGLMAWARQLANQRDTGTGAAHGFFFSSEFANQNVDNREFVTRLYRTFMNREPDQAGFDAWVAQLDAGVSREEVFNGFAQSIEFARICALYGIVR